MHYMKIPVVAIVGPTAVGKTKLSVEIAKRFNGEIISGDSMQVYKGLDIGTAKVTKDEMQGIPHYMIDIKNPEESFSVAEFKDKVQGYIEYIHNKGALPIIVGGTGLYIQSTLYQFNFADEGRDPTFVQKIETEIDQNGIDEVYQRLVAVDPEQAQKIHPNNRRRVIRALEVYEKTGLTMSELHAKQRRESPYNPIIIGLTMEREELYRRINKRVDQMVEDGLVEEVKYFYDKGLKHAQSMRGIGYKELIPYFEGDISMEYAIEQLKQNSRRYAKRQFTYFRNKLDVHWYTVSVPTIEHIFSIILRDLEGMLKEVPK